MSEHTMTRAELEKLAEAWIDDPGEFDRELSESEMREICGRCALKGGGVG